MLQLCRTRTKKSQAFQNYSRPRIRWNWPHTPSRCKPRKTRSGRLWCQMYPPLSSSQNIWERTTSRLTSQPDLGQPKPHTVTLPLRLSLISIWELLDKVFPCCHFRAKDPQKTYWKATAVGRYSSMTTSAATTAVLQHINSQLICNPQRLSTRKTWSLTKVTCSQITIRRE